MTYKDFPVYIGYGNTDFKSDWGYYRKSMIYANNVSVTNNSRATPKRTLGSSVDPDDQFYFPADSVCRISFSFNFYAKPSDNVEGDNVYAFLKDGSKYISNILGNGTGTNYFPIRVGGNVYKKCYVDDYTVSLRAYEPVNCSVNFTCYYPPEDVPMSSDRGINLKDYNDVMLGKRIITANTCKVRGIYNSIVPADVLPSITFNKKYSRTPVYELGDSKPSRFLLDGVESQMKIEATGLGNLFNFSGVKLEQDVVVDIEDFANRSILPEYFGGFDLVSHSGARVNAVDYNVQGGGTVKTNATITEVIL